MKIWIDPKNVAYSINNRSTCFSDIKNELVSYIDKLIDDSNEILFWFTNVINSLIESDRINWHI